MCLQCVPGVRGEGATPLLPSPFLVQSFKETLQYCDEWRKFTSVSQSVSQTFSHSVNSGG